MMIPITLRMGNVVDTVDGNPILPATCGMENLPTFLGREGLPNNTKSNDANKWQ